MRYLKLALACALMLPAFGCAFGTDYVHINRYTPKASGSSGNGMEVYVAKAQDNRSEPSYLGQKAGGYVALEKGLDLSNIVTDSVVSALENEGYKVSYSENPSAAAPGQGVKVLNTSIDELWTTFVQGFWTVDANARAKLTFELDDQSGRRLWKKIIGKGDVNSAVAAPPGLFEDALNGALGKVMDDFRSDIASTEFKNAIMEGTVIPAAPAPVPAPAPAPAPVVPAPAK